MFGLAAIIGIEIDILYEMESLAEPWESFP